jgi:hypothetical protein
MRLILVDNFSRWIVGDTTGFAADNEEWRKASSDEPGEARSLCLLAARLLDEHIGESGWDYQFSSDASVEASVGYLVYRVEDDQPIPVIWDGEDREAFGAAMRNCAYLGFVRWDACVSGKIAPRASGGERQPE